LTAAARPAILRLVWLHLRSLSRIVATLLRAGCALSLLMLAGCQSLLPSGKTEIVSGWKDFDEASRTLERVVPYRSVRKDVHEAGLDPASNSTITILNFSDVLNRFTANAIRPEADLEPGIRDCLKAGKRCTAYSINVKKTHQQRVSNFWLDFFNFVRETEITGWSFNALIVFVDDLVVYQLTGGQPRIKDFEKVVNPLGPLQGLGGRVSPPLD